MRGSGISADFQIIQIELTGIVETQRTVHIGKDEGAVRPERTDHVAGRAGGLAQQR
jgi:hypothetical protein